jgi:hypothetical protein
MIATQSASKLVMAGLVPAIHVFLAAAPKTWMPGTSLGTTNPQAAYPGTPFFSSSRAMMLRWIWLVPS